MNSINKTNCNKILSFLNVFGLRALKIELLAQKTGISQKELVQLGVTKKDVLETILQSIHYNQLENFKDFSKNENSIDECIDISIYLLTQNNLISKKLLFDIEKYYASHYESYIQNQSKTITEQLTKNLERGVKEALFRRDLDINSTILIYTRTITLIKETLQSEFDKPTFNKICHTYITQYIRSISNVRGIDYLESIKNDLIEIFHEK